MEEACQPRLGRRELDGSKLESDSSAAHMCDGGISLAPDLDGVSSTTSLEFRELVGSKLGRM